MPNKEDEFVLGKGRSSRDDGSIIHSWKTGYYASRFSLPYIQACYNFEKHPQAVFKVASFARGEGGMTSSKKMLDYITTRVSEIEKIDKETGEITIEKNKKYLTFYTESGEELKGQESIDAVFNKWQYEWLQKNSNSGKGDQRYATHMVFSVDRSPTKHNAAQVLAAAAKTLSEEFGEQGFEYAFTVHTDSENAHVHVVMNNYNAITQKKLRQDRQDFLRIRENFAGQLRGRGLSYIATLRRDRAEIQTKISAVINASVDTVEKWQQVLDSCTLSNKKSQISAQLTKEIKQYAFEKNKVELTFSKINHTNYHRLAINQEGQPYEDILKYIAKQEIDSQNFYIDSSTQQASLIFKHPINAIDHKNIKQAFDVQLDKYKEQQNIKLANRSVDILPKLHHTLRSLDRLKKSVQMDKAITLTTKRQTYKKIKEIRAKLLSGEDIQKLLGSSMLRTAADTTKIIKEIKHYKLSKKGLGEPELKRRQGLEAAIKNQKDMLTNIIDQLEGAPRGDKQFETDKKIRIDGLKLMHSAKTYDELLTASKGLKEQMARSSNALIRPQQKQSNKNLNNHI